jgi:hypothetical protein
MLRAAVCLCLWASAADAFMSMPSTATSAFAPAVGKRSMSLAKSGSAVRMAPALGKATLRSKPAITNLAMGKVKAEYVWIGGRGGVGDDYR